MAKIGCLLIGPHFVLFGAYFVAPNLTNNQILNDLKMLKSDWLRTTQISRSVIGFTRGVITHIPISTSVLSSSVGRLRSTRPRPNNSKFSQPEKSIIHQ